VGTTAAAISGDQGGGYGQGGESSCDDLLGKAPSPPSDYYDYFGQELDAQQAAQIVEREHLDPRQASSYSHAGMVHVTRAS